MAWLRKRCRGGDDRAAVYCVILLHLSPIDRATEEGNKGGVWQVTSSHSQKTETGTAAATTTTATTTTATTTAAAAATTTTTTAKGEKYPVR